MERNRTLDQAAQHVFFCEQTYMEYLAFMALLHEEAGQPEGAKVYNSKLEAEANRIFNPQEVNNE